MLTDQVYEQFHKIQAYYNSIKKPKYRNVNIEIFRKKYQTLVGLKNELGQDVEHIKLVNAMSQIISKLEKFEKLEKLPDGKIWSNLSERGMNKAIPPVIKTKDQIFPVEWKDKWGYDCYVSNGYWNAKNYRVMDVIGYMFLLKEGGDCLPEKPNPIFDDLFEVITAGANGNVVTVSTPGGFSVRFTGIKVLRQDGRQHHNIGVLPSMPVKPTLEGYLSGRDELLEVALAIVRGERKGVVLDDLELPK